ncbi:MAG: hypothetical protein K2N19_08155 [Muribaculaceae bacterium]|nr:hypothetical protein [Muribaculaceae bacterium]
MQTESIRGDSETSHFLSLSSSEVKGEWLGDIGEPEYDISLDQDANLIVHCKVKGRAKALNNRAAEFEALVLRNGTDRRQADTNFRHGDRMYLYFSAPVNGYLSVFLADEQDNVLPSSPIPRVMCMRSRPARLSTISSSTPSAAMISAMSTNSS